MNATSSSSYNAVVYGSFRQEVQRAVSSPQLFQTFKTSAFPRIHLTFFHQTNDRHFGTRFVECLATRAPHLLGDNALPALAKADLDIGSPSVVKQLTLPTSTISSSPLVLRYLMELSFLENAFPKLFRAGAAGAAGSAAGGATRGLNILEVGGGFGGFAVALAHVHRDRLAAYHIVDLDEVGVLQRMYVERAQAGLGAGTTSVPLKTISVEHRGNVSSDLMVSFFSISEQMKHVADAYVNQYMRHAARGYLQLNFDEGDCGASTRTVKNVNRHSAWGLFTKVYAVQPSAMLLPPPPCGAASSTSHGGHRILWGLDVAAWPL